MEKLIPLFACLLIGADMLTEIEPERIEMCNRQEFVDGPVYVDGTAVCRCYVTAVNRLYCTNMSESSLLQFQRTFSQFHVNWLIIDESNFSEINSRSFENMSVYCIQFYRTKIDNFHLFSGPNRFQGKFLALSLFECELNNWDFTYLPTFKDLRQIDIVDPVNDISDYNFINYLPNSTEYVRLNNCGISSTDQISSLSRLNISGLKLERNNLTTIERSAFPRPAYKLRYIDLSDNPIASLPEDAFTEMPRLLVVELTNTLLTTLPFNLFQEALIRHTPDSPFHLRILGIPLHCDNKIAWMKNQNGRLDIDEGVVCKSPNALAGMELKDVDFC